MVPVGARVSECERATAITVVAVAEGITSDMASTPLQRIALLSK
jgi:hypothetical protein